MKNRPPEEKAVPSGVSVAMLSWFVYPGMGHFSLGRKGLGKAWAAVFSLFLVLAMGSFVKTLSDVYGSATSLSDLPSDMDSRLAPILGFGGVAALIWLACGLDAWLRALRARASERAPAEAPEPSPPAETP